MAHVENRGRGRWVAVWKAPNGRRQARSFPRKLDADRFLATVTVDVLSGRYVDPKAGVVPLGAYAARWVETQTIRPNTRASYRANLKHLRELDDVALGSLSPSLLRTWQAAVYARVAPSTAFGVRRMLAAILKTAVVDRIIASSPLDAVPAPSRVPGGLVVPMPPALVVELAELITPRLSAAVYVGAGCGLRRGEVMGLTVDRVDFLRRSIRVDRQLVGGNIVDGPVFGPPKTTSSVRTVPAPQLVVDELARHLQRYEPGPAGLIFTGRNGAAFTPGRFTPVWRDALTKRWVRDTGRELTRAGYIRAELRRAYLDAHPDGSEWTFHDLRHFYASTLIADGQSVRVVQARLGHATAVETLNTYSHLWPDDEDRTRAALDRTFAALGNLDGDNGRAYEQRQSNTERR